jgi:hypothetical protein
MLYWGKKRLGIIAPHTPLVVTRPRGSGALDVVAKSDGFIPVQTGATPSPTARSPEAYEE